MKLEISKPLLDIRIKDTFLHVDPLGLQKLYFDILCCKTFDVSNQKWKCNLINYIYNVNYNLINYIYTVIVI